MLNCPGNCLHYWWFIPAQIALHLNRDGISSTSFNVYNYWAVITFPAAACLPVFFVCVYSLLTSFTDLRNLFYYDK